MHKLEWILWLTSLYCPWGFFCLLQGKPRCRTFFLYLMVNLCVAVSESVSWILLDHPPSCGLAVRCRRCHPDLQLTRTCIGFYYKNERSSPQEAYFNTDKNSLVMWFLFYWINNICKILPKIVNKQLEDLYFMRIIRLVQRRKLRFPRNVILVGERLGVKTWRKESALKTLAWMGG